MTEDRSREGLRMHWRGGIGLGIALSLLPWSSGAFAQDAYVGDAKAFVARVSSPNPPWDGPTQGPAAARGKTVIYVSADQSNGGAAGVGRAAEEAAKAIGWSFRLIDGQGTTAGRRAALEQAAEQKPDGIILGTVDASEQADLIRNISRRGIKVVGWHALAKPGPAPESGIFTNVTTDPLDVARAAGLFAVADSNGTAQAVIFTDPAYAIGIAKANAMAEVIGKCKGCSVLAIERVNHGQFRSNPGLMAQRTASLLQRFGTKWSYALGDNDIYFDYMISSLVAAAIPGSGGLNLISAGDGSEVAFERIRKGQYQIGTVAEPLRLHGWQVIDELNRALTDGRPSGYTAPVHLVRNANIRFDGGARNEFDPDNGYRDAYRRIWGAR
jgi:ribose transport system substrate-binding protein